MKLTPYQRIRNAAMKGTGLRLTEDECWRLGAMDEAIISRAAQDWEEQDKARATHRASAPR